MERDRDISNLPDFAYHEVFKYLDYKDIRSASLACKHWNAISSEDIIWKPLCKFYWLLETIPDNCVTWKDAFTLFEQKYSDYINEYRHIKGAWSKIEKWYENNCPEVLHNLQDGIDESTLEEFEKENGVFLPKDLKLSFLLHNGQSGEAEIGILGSLFEQSSFTAGNMISNFLCSFETSQENYDNSRKMLLLNVSPDPEVLVSPAKFFLFYQKLSEADQEENTNDIVACSRYVTGENYVASESYTQWLWEFAEKLASGSFATINGQVALYDSTTEVKAVTENITVTVRWAFVPGWNQNQARFEYFIQMEMDETATEHEACKLESRYWIIRDDDTKHHETVSGNGVVGAYPTMKPGAKFYWQSSTWFQNKGCMGGHFVMHRLRNPGFKINVACPNFYMVSPWKKLN
uniref:F-box only protein 3-like n=1 Tax=Phallusia mammillata TaxID=59560 RepID=A0A6F9DDA1_9ASCI|nr:F-box only protein 3-like [Phallusia mammillata]